MRLKNRSFSYCLGERPRHWYQTWNCILPVEIRFAQIMNFFYIYVRNQFTRIFIFQCFTNHFNTNSCNFFFSHCSDEERRRSVLYGKKIIFYYYNDTNWKKLRSHYLIIVIIMKYRNIYEYFHYVLRNSVLSLFTILDLTRDLFYVYILVYTNKRRKLYTKAFWYKNF